MNSVTKILSCLALFVAGLVATTLSVPLQAPVVVLVGLTAILVAVRFFKSGGLREQRWLQWLFLVSFVYFVIRACLSPVIDLGIEDLMLILPAGLFYLVIREGLLGKEGVKLVQSLAWVVIVILLLHLGATFLQLQGGDGYSLSRYFTSASRASEGRITGMYGYYGSFANFAVISGLLCVSLGVWGRFILPVRFLILLLGLVALAASIWSQSRSAAVSLIIALVVFMILMFVSVRKQNQKVRSRARKILSVFSLLALSGAGVMGVWVFKVRAGSEEGADMLFSSGRYPFWTMAVEQYLETPFVGSGSRSYSYECFRYWSPNVPTSAANPEFVHNEYLQLLVDYGIVGLLFVLTLIIWHLVVGLKRVYKLSEQVTVEEMKVGSNAMALSIAGVCGMTAMAVHIIFDFRTHLLANLLLLLCCVLWVLPISRVNDKSKILNGYGGWTYRLERAVIALIMVVMGIGAMALGSQQIWAGLPLLQHKAAKEDGEWMPELVDRSVWIPMLEESVKRSPNWRRYQRLGTLYRLEANNSEGKEKESAILRAKAAYTASIERHEHNPISKINLASIYAEEQEFELADRTYSSASEMATARERWFRMHSKWSEMHKQWAIEEWKQKKWDNAEDHFVRAAELSIESRDAGSLSRDKEWVVQYTRLLIIHARFLDAQNKFEDSRNKFEEARFLPNWYWWGRDTRSHYMWSLHSYDYGRYVWGQRRPEEALQLMKLAKKHLKTYQRLLKDDVGESWHAQMKKTQEVIDFLEKTGVGK